MPASLASGVPAWLQDLPDGVVYLLLGLGAGIENVIPAIPADTFVVLGGFLAAATGELEARWVFLATWVCNVSSALAMYRVGFTHGRDFFGRGWGRRLLNPHQMERMALFYGRWGPAAIFLTRFLPGVRAVVPVFAGVTHQHPLSVAIPLALASAVWYGALVWAGTVAGHNLSALMQALGRVNAWLLVVAVGVIVAAATWWWRTRHPR